MKKTLATSLACLLALTACSSNTPSTNNGGTGDTGNETAERKPFRYVYATDITAMDYIIEDKQTNSMHVSNFVTGLMEVNHLGELVGDLAESYESNEDATKFTFKLRKDLKWVTADGEVYPEPVTAQDWVTGLQHAVDFQASALYMVEDLIVGIRDYEAGKIGFDEVGVKALDDYTIEYTLSEPAPYFPTMHTYGILSPVKQSFLEAQGAGCALGAPDKSTCMFGTTEPSSILYNGPYILTNFTAKSVIEYQMNPNYWDTDHVYIDSVKLIYNDGADPAFAFNGFDAGEYDQATVDSNNAATYQLATEKYGDSIYNSNLTSTAFYLAFNLDRNAYCSPMDNTKGCSEKTDKQKADTKLANLNENFRKAIMFGWDRTMLLSQRYSAELKDATIRNTLTMPDFVQTSDGQLYVDLVEEELAKLDQIWEGIDLSDGVNAYYKPELAKEFAAKAREELEAQGVEFPIVLDDIVDQGWEMGVRQEQALEQSIESTLGSDFVDVRLVLTDQDNQQYSTYFVNGGYESNWDISNSVGWGPDYGDPKSYLDILLPEDGVILKNLGLDPTGEEQGDDEAAKQTVGLYEIGEKIVAAGDIINDNDARYKAYAAVEAQILNEALMIPYMSQGGSFVVSRLVPYTNPYSFYGNSADHYKWRKVGDHIYTSEERAQLKAEWEAARQGK